MNDSNKERVRILLTVQAALLGEIFPGLNAVDVSWEAGKISLKFFVDGPITDEDKDSISSVEAEIIADCPDEEIESVVIFDNASVDNRGMVCVFAKRPN